MKLRAEVDGSEYLLDLTPRNGEWEYKLSGVEERAGSASIVETMPGAYSVLLGSASFQVRVASRGEELEVWTNGRRQIVSVADARDRSPRTLQASAAGPLEIRAQMPGKVIEVLVTVGEAVEAGQGVIVVEAMKMQNEMKSPKAGRIARIQAVQGATVAAGETLVIVE